MVAKKSKETGYTYKTRRGVLKDVLVLKNGKYQGNVSKVTGKGKGIARKSIYLTGDGYGKLDTHKTEKSAVRKLPKSTRSEVMKRL